MGRLAPREAGLSWSGEVRDPGPEEGTGGAPGWGGGLRARSKVKVSKLEPKGTGEKVHGAGGRNRRAGGWRWSPAATQGDGHAGAGETEQG